MNYSFLLVVPPNLQYDHILFPRPTPPLSLPTQTLPVSRWRIPFEFLPLLTLIPLFYLCFPRRKTYPPPMLQVGKSSIQCLYRPSHMVTLLSFDVKGASARSFLLTSPARCLFPSQPPFRLRDEDGVSTVLDTNDIRREKEKRQQWETTNIDSQEAVLGLLFPLGRAPESTPASSPPLHNINLPTISSSSSRIRPAVPSSAIPNSILTTATSLHIPSSSSPRFDSNVFPTAPTLTILAKRKQIHPSTQSPFENGYLRPYDPPRSAPVHPGTRTLGGL